MGMGATPRRWRFHLPCLRLPGVYSHWIAWLTKTGRDKKKPRTVPGFLWWDFHDLRAYAAAGFLFFADVEEEPSSIPVRGLSFARSMSTGAATKIVE